MVRRYRKNAFLPKLPLLISESADEFEAMYEAIELEIKPRGTIEQMYVADISYITWDILRLRHCKTTIINAAFSKALTNVLRQALREPGNLFSNPDAEAETLAVQWFTDKKVKTQVSEKLSEFQLDESAIEAEAIRASMPDLERIDRMLASLEARRTKALGCVADHVLAQQLRESSNRMINGKEVRQLEDRSGKRSTAA